MKLETINKFIRPFGFILVVETCFERLESGLFKDTDEPTKLYFMSWKKYLALVKLRSSVL